MIQGYCKDRIGHRYIESGDYEMVRSENNMPIHASNFEPSIEPGTTLEMGIVLRKDQSNPSCCPKCSCIHREIVYEESWIEWCVQDSTVPCWLSRQF